MTSSEMNVLNICRICLTDDTRVAVMQPLFEANNLRCTEIIRKIEECGGITIKSYDQFPKSICEECLLSLDVSYKFRSMCQASEHALLDKIVKSELNSETTEFVHVNSNEVHPAAVDSKLNISKLYTFNNDEIDIELSMAKINEKKREKCKQENQQHQELGNDTDADSSGSEYIPEDDNDNIEDDEADDTKEMFESKNILPNQKPPKMVTKKVIKQQKTVKRNPKSKTLPVTLATRNRKKKDSPPVKIMCELCGNMYSKQSILNLHMRRHLSEKPYACELCNKAFACQTEMNRHMRVHTGDKPFACKFCGRTFGDRSTNLKHERIHTNERPFLCKTCGKAFSYSNVLKNHMLTHTGEKPFRCGPCDKTFSRKHQLVQHMGTRTHKYTVKNGLPVVICGEIQQQEITHSVTEQT